MTQHDDAIGLQRGHRLLPPPLGGGKESVHTAVDHKKGGFLRHRLRAIAVQYWRLIHRAIPWYTAQTTAWISVPADVDDRCEACPSGRRRSVIHGNPLPALSGGPWG